MAISKKAQKLAPVSKVQSLDTLQCKTFYDLLDSRGKRFVICQGGSRSGKTYSILQYIIRLCWNYKNQGLVITICRATSTSLRDTAQKTFFEIIDKLGWYSEAHHMKSTKEYRLFGNLIQFRGLDDSQKVRGAERDVLFINEANEVDQETFTQLNMRTKIKVIVDYNPSEEFWTEDLKLRDNAAFFITTFRDNPYLGQAQIDEIKMLEFTNPSLYKIYGLGLFADIEGLVYTNWAAATKFPNDCRNVAYGLDFGFSNDVTALVKCGLWGGEIYAEEKIYQTGLTNLDLNKLLKDPAIIDNRRLPIIADPGGGGAMNIVELRRMGWNIQAAKKGAGSISFGISMVQPYKLNLIGENIIKERKNYAYVKDKRGGFLNEPVDRWNHGMDGLRYWGIENLSAPVIVQKRRVAGI